MMRVGGYPSGDKAPEELPKVSPGPAPGARINDRQVRYVNDDSEPPYQRVMGQTAGVAALTLRGVDAPLSEQLLLQAYHKAEERLAARAVSEGVELDENPVMVSVLVERFVKVQS